MKIIRISMAMLLMFAVSLSAAEKTHPGALAERDKFYNIEMKAYGFSEKDIAAVRRAGFSPQFSYLLLAIATESKQPADTVVALRTEGYNLKEICDRVGVDYEKMYYAYSGAAMAKDQQFPHPSPEEGKKDVSTGPHPSVKGGKSK